MAALWVLLTPLTFVLCTDPGLYLLVDPPRPPSKALINKRKLCKPVGTSETKAADKEKGEEEDKKKEDEEEDEEIDAKSSARTATRSSGLVRTSFVKVWYRIRAPNNITTHRSRRLFVSQRGLDRAEGSRLRILYSALVKSKNRIIQAALCGQLAHVRKMR